MVDTLSKPFLTAIREDPRYNVRNSWTWFQTNVRKVALGHAMTPQRFMRESGTALFTQFKIGQLVLFGYDAKLKDKLPYWDRYPLVLPFSLERNAFKALNMHYLHPRLRLILLDKLLDTINEDVLTPKSRLLLSWRMLRNFSKYPQVAPCVKMYLKNHVRTKFLVIDPRDWTSAIFLPLERFGPVKPEEVWGNATTQIISRNKSRPK